MRGAFVKPHGERKHSKFSASASERWFNCQGSVLLSEGLPDKSSVWSLEGTKAHEVLEQTLLWLLEIQDAPLSRDREMNRYAREASKFILGLYKNLPGSDIQVETRIHLEFIHPEMFGTFDGAVLDYFGTLHVFDYKYGAGHSVGPKENLQMIFYGIGLAHLHQWNFKRVRLWIIQPRVKGYDGPLFWEISIQELKGYVKLFREAVERVEKFPKRYVEGSWCHWCKAKGICPLKLEGKLDEAKSIFSAIPL